MKKIAVIILFIITFGSVLFANTNIFIEAIRQKDYSSSLQYANSAAECMQTFLDDEITWSDYLNLMLYADSIQHQYRDSLIIHGVIYLVKYGMWKSDNEEYESAISIYEAALYLTTFMKSQLSGIAMGINNQLAINYGHLAQYDKSITYAQNSYEYAIKLHEDTSTITSALNNLGLYNYYAGYYEDASDYLQQAYQLSLSLSTDDAERIRTASNLTLVLTQMGLLDASLKILEECIASSQKDLVHLPILLNNACEICINLGKYDIAIDYAEKGLNLLSQSTQTRNQKQNSEAILINNLAVAYHYLNNINKAILWAEKGLSVYTPTDPNDYAFLLSNMGVIYSKIDSQKAFDYYRDAMNIVAKDNINYPLILSNIGFLCYSLGMYKEALKFFEEALNAMYKLASIANPSHIAIVCSNLSAIHKELGNQKLSLRYCEDAIDIALLGDVNDDLHALLKSNRAFKYSFIKGKELHAFDLWYDVLQTYTNLTANHFDYLTEEERSMYWQKSQTMHDFIPAFVYEHHKKHPQFTPLAYNNALLTKGMLLQSTNHVRKSIEQSGDTLLQQQWEELLKTQQMLTSSALPKTTKDSLTNRAESLETWIMKNSRDFRQSKEIWEKDWTDVKNVLKDGEVAIEFIDFYSIIKHDKTEHIYAALLVRPNDKRPIFVPLCAEEEIHSQLGNPTQTYDINGSELYELIWSQITPYLAENNTIYFAPSGLLHQLNIELLPMQDLRPISDVYNLVRVSSTRELLLEHGNTSFTSATLYGGLIYDMDTTDMIANSSIYDDMQYRSFSLSDTLSRKGVAYLPGTKKEIESISLCLQSTDSEIRMFTGAQGNEESFKAQTGGNNNILHIATHGFFFEDEEVNITDLFKPQMQQIGQREQVLDPLLRSGLLLAGSNYAFTGHFEQLPKSLQDGVLYAKEISLLDLSETELVVLSACETGQGDITSEGVFGLQRAFKMAGVQTIIMSLWKVNDQATQLLMTEFYNNWIGKHQSKREAFRNAQNTVRSKYEEPEYWAGFIMLD